MDKLFIEKNIGRCLTEYTHINYQKMIGNFKRFITISQFDATPEHINELVVALREGRVTKVTEPTLSYGQILFGVEKDGTLTKLKSIIDSSD